MRTHCSGVQGNVVGWSLSPKLVSGSSDLLETEEMCFGDSSVCSWGLDAVISGGSDEVVLYRDVNRLKLVFRFTRRVPDVT